ncbi:MAG: hypothetical protein AAF340_14255 [Pseudomonadota bacterium]
MIRFLAALTLLALIGCGVDGEPSTPTAAITLETGTNPAHA